MKNRPIEAKPIPPQHRGLTGDLLKLINPNDSFLIRDEENVSKGTLHSLASRLKIRIITRLDADGLRVWRSFDAVAAKAVTITPKEKPLVNIKMNDAMAKFMDKIGVVETEPVTADEWQFTKDKPQYDDSGYVYRQQYLVSNPRKRRSVRVDEDDHNRIL